MCLAIRLENLLAKLDTEDFAIRGKEKPSTVRTSIEYLSERLEAPPYELRKAFKQLTNWGCIEVLSQVYFIDLHSSNVIDLDGDNPRVLEDEEEE